MEGVTNKFVNSVLREAYRAIPKKVPIDGEKVIVAHNNIKNMLENLHKDTNQNKK